MDSLNSQSPAQRAPYLDPALPIAQRVDDLVGRMTLAEKVAQMQNEAPAIPRLHVAEYDWWNEGLHGVARSGYATVFPQAIGMAATFDTDLSERIGDAISTEARAKYNDALLRDNHAIFYGLTLWSPNINIDRDPRWGRGQETYGEDPFLTGQIGSAFVRGLQGSDPAYLKVVATAKHFAVHSGPESSRHTFDVAVSAHDLEDTYLPAFRAVVVGARAASVMCAYNAVDGTPACASNMLLQNTLKQDWHFKGFVVSDCAAITDVAIGHRFASDMAHAAALSVKAGTDLSCGTEYSALVSAVHQNLISESEIDRAVKRLFTARFRLGMFDPPAAVAYNSIPFSENDSRAHAALALEAARRSMVLLKDSAGTLPLAKTIRTIAVIGPNAAALPALEGNYNAVASHPVTPLAALEQRLPGHVLYAQGSPYVGGVPIPVPPSAFVDLKAEFFRDANFHAAPVATRADRNIDFDWNGAAPVPEVGAQSFSVRWTGELTAPAPGVIPFAFAFSHCSTCDDAESVSVWLDDRPVYNFIHARTHGRRASTTPFTLTFADTNPHRIRILYTHDAAHFGAGLTFNWQPPLSALREQAVAAANQSDAIVAFLGLSPEIEGEEMPLKVEGFAGGDRTAIELPAAQQQLVSALAATGKPLVIVLMNGGAIALQSAAEEASSILEAWYPGEAGGTAIAETLFGENNPSGRLPVTFYASTAQLPPFDSYAMDQRTYRYFTGTPLYPFGFGLSYTTFAFSSAKLSTETLAAGQPLDVTAELQNTGTLAGDDTVEFYLIPRHIPGAPIRTLVGFEKVHLKPGESRAVHTIISPRALSLVSGDGTRSVLPGDYELYVGDGPPTASHGVTSRFRIVGSSPFTP